MITADTLNKIRSVTIHHDHCIRGFKFFDKDRKLLWVIGVTGGWLKKETVVLEENEVIVGVVAKLYSDFQSVYTDLQFQITLE